MSDNIIFTNNASALLAATITDSDLTVQVASGFGDLFPSPTGGEFFYATLEDDSGNIEIVKCTARSGDNLTVVRAQDGSTAQAFTLTVTRVELRLVKVVLEEFLQKNGGTMTGDIDMNTNSITDAVLDGSSTQITAGEIVGVPLRGAAGVSSNELAVPVAPGRATVGGAAILATGDDIVAELDTAGVIILDSATVGVRILDTAYLRIEGDDSGDYLQIDMDNTDVNFTFAGVTEVNWDAILSMTADLKMNDNEVQGALFVDFGIKKQAVNASASTTIDYSAGSYVVLTLDTDITTFAISNVPASDVATLRIKIVNSGDGNDIDFTDLPVNWAGGNAPTLSQTDGTVDFVDLWSDDGGTTWYGTAALAWDTP